MMWQPRFDWKTLQQRLRNARAAAGLSWETVRKLAPALKPVEVFSIATFEATGQPGRLDYWAVYDLVRALETLAGKRLQQTTEFSAPAPCRYDRCLEAWRRGDYRQAAAILEQLK